MSSKYTDQEELVGIDKFAETDSVNYDEESMDLPALSEKEWEELAYEI